MKTLTAITAAVALLSSLSIVSAQNTMGKSSGSMGGSAPHATGNAAFCINTSASGALNCKYATMAACEKDAKPQNLNCSPNPNKGTTGAKQ